MPPLNSLRLCIKNLTRFHFNFIFPLAPLCIIVPVSDQRRGTVDSNKCVGRTRINDVILEVFLDCMYPLSRNERPSSPHTTITYLANDEVYHQQDTWALLLVPLIITLRNALKPSPVEWRLAGNTWGSPHNMREFVSWNGLDHLKSFQKGNWWGALLAIRYLLDSQVQN